MTVSVRLLVWSLLLLFSMNSFSAPRTMQDVLTSGELRVGVALFQPWVMKAKDGRLIGSEPDIARRLAADMGVKVVFSEMDWEQLIPALKNNHIDIIVAGMDVTPSRALQVNFSRSYAESGIGLATHIANTKNIKMMGELQKASITVGSVAGTSADELSKRLFKSAKLKTFFSMKEAGDALIKGEVDALVGPDVEMSFLRLHHPSIIEKPLSKRLLNTVEAFAVRKGDHDFINFLNAWITAHKADSWLESTRYYWFKTLRWYEGVEQ